MSEAQTGADLALKAAHQPQIIKDYETGRSFLLYPSRASECGFDKEEISVDGFLVEEPAPHRIVGSVELQTTGSLVNYTNRFKNDDSVLFADIYASKIVARLAYHGPSKPDHNDHDAVLALPFSEEWRLWTEIDGKLMPQLAFARFIEENAKDILAPSGAALLDVVQDLQAVRKADFSSSVRTDGKEKFEYTESTTAQTRGNLDIPTEFQLRLPVYFNDVSVDLMAFLRWKVEDKALQLGVKIARREYVRQGAFVRIVDEVARETALTTVYGKS